MTNTTNFQLLGGVVDSHVGGPSSSALPAAINKLSRLLTATWATWASFDPASSVARFLVCVTPHEHHAT
jgi:hypothetical protein